MKIIISFYNSHWSEQSFEYEVKVIPRVGEFIWLEWDFCPDYLREKAWEVKRIEHTFNGNEQLINIQVL